MTRLLREYQQPAERLLTMVNLEAVRDEIKAAAVACDGTPTAKFVAVLVAAGITDTKDIAAILGVGERAVQKVRKANSGTPNHSSPNQGSRTTVRNEPQDANHSSEPNHSSPKSEPQFVSEPRVRARIETPSGLLSHEDIGLDSPPSGPPKPKAKPKSERGKRLALDWQLPDEWRDWTRIHFAHASDAQIETEAEKFRDFWHAKSGQGATKLDWQATWRNWCRTAFAPRASAYPINTGRASWDEQRAKKQADTRAFMERMGLSTGAVQ
jgi:hypothetical protein